MEVLKDIYYMYKTLIVGLILRAFQLITITLSIILSPLLVIKYTLDKDKLYLIDLLESLGD